MPSQHFQVLRKHANSGSEFVVFIDQNSTIFDGSFELTFHMPHFEHELLIDNRLIDVHWILNWYFDRNFHSFLDFNRRTFDVDWLVNVNWFLHYFGHLNLNLFDDFSLDFLDDFNWNFFLNFNVFRNFYNFLNNSFRSWNHFGYLDNDLYRFLNYNFLNGLLRNT